MVGGELLDCGHTSVSILCPSSNPHKSSASPNAAISTLEKLRDHFYRLRLETGTRKANDYLYALREQTMKERPEASDLKALLAALESAGPSLRIADSREMYQKAKDDWTKRVGPILADDSVAPSEIEPLRSATGVFYREYGMQIE